MGGQLNLVGDLANSQVCLPFRGIPRKTIGKKKIFGSRGLAKPFVECGEKSPAKEGTVFRGDPILTQTDALKKGWSDRAIFTEGRLCPDGRTVGNLDEKKRYTGSLKKIPPPLIETHGSHSGNRKSKHPSPTS